MRCDAYVAILVEYFYWFKVATCQSGSIQLNKQEFIQKLCGILVKHLFEVIDDIMYKLSMVKMALSQKLQRCVEDVLKLRNKIAAARQRSGRVSYRTVKSF